MQTNSVFARRAAARDLLFFQTPELWPQYPFLPVVHRRLGVEDDPELGLLYDARGVSGTLGFSATVFLCNLFTAPRAEAEFLRLPRIVYDTAQEIGADGWTVD